MKYLLNFSVAILAVGALSSCDMYSPSNMNENLVRVSESVINTDIAVADIDDAFIGELARHYSKHGGSPMDIVITYDPKSSHNTAMRASHKASDIVGYLNDYGVSNVGASILPVNAQGGNSRLMVSYNALIARAPKGCDTLMSGMDGSLEGANPDYKLGCSIDSMVARQIARPSDLLGRGAAAGGTTDGRSAANIIDGYRTGAQNKALKGMSASDD